VIGDVIVADSKRDLAVLQLRSLPASVAVLPLAAKSIEVAHKVYTVGNPGASGGLWVYTDGIVRQVVFKKIHLDNRQIMEAWMIEAQLAINQGDSGGPVVNDKIELVGVNCSFNIRAQSFSNCVDLREVLVVLEKARRAQNTFGGN
jgi:S1-C subfamily serine protease